MLAAAQNRPTGRRGAAIGKADGFRLDRAVVTNPSPPLMRMCVDLGIEVGATIEGEADLAGSIGDFESHTRLVVQSTVGPPSGS